MKIVLWSIVAVLALLWTGSAAALSELVRWAGQAIAAQGAPPLGTIAGSLQLPAWLRGWIDPAAWSAAQQAVADVLNALAASMPAVGTLVGWLVPAVWVLWGLGIVVLIGVGLLGAWLVRRLDQRPAAVPG